MVKPILKSIWAVLAGLLTVVVLSILTDIILEATGIFPPQTSPELYTNTLLAIALVYRCIYALAGGFVTAKLSPSNPMKHVTILAVIGTILGILGTIANWDKTLSGQWYPISLVILSLVCVLLGGKLGIKK